MMSSARTSTGARSKASKRNELPIYEPGLSPLVERNQQQARLTFTMTSGRRSRRRASSSLPSARRPTKTGRRTLRHVLAVAEQIGRHMTRELVVVTKSTVPVGTAAKVAAAVGRHARVPFHLCSNPEFLKEGAAVDDFLKPDRVVLGRRDRPRAQRDGGAVRAVRADRASRSSSWTSRPPR